MVLLLTVLGCGHNQAVFQGYEKAKTAAMVDPGPAPAAWKPDVRVEISPPLLDRLVRLGLESAGSYTAEVDFGLGKATPTLMAQKVALGPSRKCPTCFTVDLDLDGHIDWTAGMLGKGTVPAQASARFEVELTTVRDGDDWVVQGLPRDVRRVSIEVPGWSAAVRRAANAPLERWLNQQVEQLEPFPLTRIGGTDLPIRALGVEPRGTGIKVLALSAVPDGGQVLPDGGQIPKQGFAVWVANRSVVQFAARKAFEQGPGKYDVVPVPTSLAIHKNGFELGLRLWGLRGRGWWRDYRATGGVKIYKGEFGLEAQQVDQVAMSKGAVAADPLMFLAQGMVVDVIHDALQVALPAVHEVDMGTASSRTVVHALRGENDSIRIAGDVVPNATKGKGKGR